MRKNVIVFGLIAGAIVSTMMIIGVAACYNSMNFDLGMWLGYSSMIIAFSFVFVGIKNYRDKHNQGTISFKKAFIIGLWITLIASSIYVVVWMIDYYFFIPDFMDKYNTYMIEHSKSTGVAQADLDKQMAEMAKYKEMYKNPIFVILFTYMEILPVGLIITLISALILKRKVSTPESSL
jgi:amino acid transporter